LPSVARERRYTATISLQALYPPVKVALSGANFIPESTNVLLGFHTPDGATFEVNDTIYYYSGSRALAGLPPGGEVYLARGRMEVTRSGNDLVGSLNGAIRVALGPHIGNIVGQCTSVHHSVTFTNQSGSPAR